MTAIVWDMPKRPKCLVSPVKLRRFVPELECMVQRTIGYRADCTCGYHGRCRNHPSEAREDRREHEATHGA